MSGMRCGLRVAGRSGGASALLERRTAQASDDEGTETGGIEVNARRLDQMDQLVALAINDIRRQANDARRRLNLPLVEYPTETAETVRLAS